MDIKYVTKQLSAVSARMQGSNVKELLTGIATKSRNLQNIDLDDQLTMAGILGSYLHQGYCDDRKLKQPLPNGLQNEPRIKQLSEKLDEDFVKDVINGKIKTSDTLWVENGEVNMDIANTPFTQLSPYWQYDNFMAGACATRSVITNWEGITHQDPQVRKYVTVAVANAIHESWIARGNVGDWNKELETAYINLPENQKEKDLKHYRMATSMVDALARTMNKETSNDMEIGR
jgi:hypothetical protein